MQMKRHPAAQVLRTVWMAAGLLLLRQGAAAEAPAGPGQLTLPASLPSNWLTYHLIHPGPGGTYPADPNCALFWKGRYHLHYIYQPGRYNHCFAHVSSADMVHWAWKPTSLLTANTHHGMFSGTAFVTREGKPAVIYHGLGSGKNQISIALDDSLEQWSPPYPLEAKTAAGQPSAVKFWDPDCWLDDGTYYAISGGKPAFLFKSADLKEWLELGPLLHPDMPKDLGVSPAEDISCPNMFKIADPSAGPGKSKWMLLCISHGMGCRYYLGDFKDGKYLPSFHGRMNWRGHEVFAPESLLTPDGRRVMWAWCELKGPFQGGIQCLPRELSLGKDGRLRIAPLRELATLRGEEKRQGLATLKSGDAREFKDMSGDALEIEATFKPGTAARFGLQVHCDPSGSNGFAVAVDPAAKTLTLGGTLKVPFELASAEEAQLRVFVDKYMVEVFANGRQAALAAHAYKPEHVGVRFYCEGGSATLKSARCWKMKSAYAEPEKAPKP